MDARLVLARTPTIAQASAPAYEFDASEDDFAAHLPPDEPVQSAPGAGRIEEARKEDAANDRDEDEEDAPSEGETALSTPFAPVLVRPQNSVVTFDLSALLAQSAAAAASLAPAAVQTPAAAQTPADATAAVSPEIATADQAQQPQANTTKPAADPAALSALEALTASATAQGKTEIRPLRTLRAGRGEGVAEGGPEFKAPANANAPASSPSSSQVAGAAKVQTANAVQPVVASTQTQDVRPAPDSAPQLVGAAPADQRAHRLNEASGAMGHRATTPAALVAQHVIRRFDGRSTSIDVRLDPAELGRVQVTLDVGADNKVTAVVSAENPATLADLVRSSRELERALQDAGLSLDSGDLTFDLAQRGDGGTSGSKGEGSRSGAGQGQTAETNAPAASRPFGLETWRGARVDVMV